MCCPKQVLEMGTQSLRAPIFALSIKDSVPYSSQSITTASSNPNTTSKISPAVLFIIVILAIVFFISGLLHLLVRFLIRKSPSSASSPHWQASAAEFSGPDALQRQLQQLFHLHDSGLDQVFIDALPVFLYREIVGTKEPFDCAVCLCEFAEEDKLRLLPLCGHAFHLNCIDTWLLSNSTCPLCRGALFIQGIAIENPIFYFEDFREDGRPLAEREDEGDEIVLEKRLFPVRLGKFKNLGGLDGGGAIGNAEDCRVSAGDVQCEQGECSSSNLDARRCFSMGSYQYVVAKADLQVALSSSSIRNVDSKGVRNRAIMGHRNNTVVMNGKRLDIGSKAESFSVSKIWQWSNKKGKFPVTVDDTSPDGNFQWVRNNVGNS